MAKVLRVAVVDDEEDEYLALAGMLRQEPFYRVSADWLGRPAEAVQAILDGDYQVVLLDYRMQPVSGLAVARDLRAMDCEVPIIMVSGAANPAIERAAIHAHIDYFLWKDQINAAQLSTTLHFAIAGWRYQGTMSRRRHVLTGLPGRRLFQEFLNTAIRVAAPTQVLELGMLEADIVPVDSKQDADSLEAQHAWREFALRVHAALPDTALVGHLDRRTLGCMLLGPDAERARWRGQLESVSQGRLRAAGQEWQVSCRLDWQHHQPGWTGTEWILHAGVRAPAKGSGGAVGGPAADPALRYYGRRALMVEDNRVNQVLAKKMLDGLGVTCDIATNGEEAVQRAAQDHYDVIFMDIEMPVMDGFEAANLLRQQRLSVTPIVALTGREDEGIRARCRKVHMNGYLVKPLKKPALTRVLDRIFDL